ncbi:MAG TPA: DUF6503 family protein [Chthoniobacterales bacterium]|nr:DUF6503 family protein [Chthoniobacterales bacterium]
MRKSFVFPLFVALSLAGAQEQTPQQIVEQAIEHAGGWDAWMNTKTVQFRKTTVRFNEDGTVRETRVQFHKYLLHPSPQMRIEWESNGSQGVFLNDGQQTCKFVNGRPSADQADTNAARNNTFGSHYVFAMPFKLRDPGTNLEDAGAMTLEDGTVVQKIRTTYDKGAGDAGGMHTWIYMIDPQTGRLLANHLQYEADKWDWTEYYDEKPLVSLLISTRRVGYAADANGKIGPKRSETIYDQLESNVEFPRDLFKAPR